MDYHHEYEPNVVAKEKVKCMQFLILSKNIYIIAVNKMHFTESK